jgi:hypothetical protein
MSTPILGAAAEEAKAAVAGMAARNSRRCMTLLSMRRATRGAGI